MTGTAFVRPDMTEGDLWFETPQTETAMAALFSLLDVARQDDPGWHPQYVLCGPAGVGTSALARRFVAQAHRSLACDAIRDADSPTKRIPSPHTFMRRDEARARYEEYQGLSPLERVRRFGSCPAICRPAEFVPEEVFAAALRDLDRELPVAIGELRPREGITHALTMGRWRTPGNRSSDPLRRTSVFLIDDADHLRRLGVNKRGEALAQMRDWPRHIGLHHEPITVLVGTPALADAVAECGEVCRIDLPAMASDGPAGIFALVCRAIFGAVDPMEIDRLHAACRGTIGALLTIARLWGLRPPFAVTDADILRLPGPGQD